MQKAQTFFFGGEQELWPALPCQKLGEQLLHLLPLFQRPCLGVYVGDASVRVFLFHGATDENVRNLYSRISGVFRIWQRGSHGERAERKPITGVWGGAPSGVQGQSPWSGSQGAKPPEAETPFAFKRSMEAANSPIFSEIRKRRKSQRHIRCNVTWRFLIAYCIGMKKDHQTLLNFAILAGKRQKTHLFI